MHPSLNIIVALLAIFPLGITALLTPTLLVQFPPSVRIENLAILHNGTVILCNAFTGEILGVNPSHSPSGVNPYTITSLAPYSSAIFGLTAASPFTIAATASNFSWNDGLLSPGSNSVHHITITKTGPETRVFPIPSALWLNGLTPVHGSPHYLLIADCAAGTLLRLDMRTGAVRTVSSDPLFAPVAGAQLPIGINGVRSIKGYVYFTNTGQGLYGRLAITSEGIPVGTPVEVITRGIYGSTYDDFALSNDGIGYLATGLGSLNGIEEVEKTGATRMVSSWEIGSHAISQPVSAVLGKTTANQRMLYFATAGQYLGIDEAPTGGQLFAMELDC